MQIHAYRRKAATQVDTGTTIIVFEPNAVGDVVADVPLESDAELLLGIPEAYCDYEPTADAKSTKKAESTPGTYVLKNGEDELDLSTMDDDALKAFAKENDIKVHHASKGDTLRAKIADAFKA